MKTSLGSLLGLTLGSVFFVGGCGDALVGGACAVGYVPLGDDCVLQKVDGDSVSASSGGDGGRGEGGDATGVGGAGGAGAGSTGSLSGAGGALGTGGAQSSSGTGFTCFAPLASCDGQCVNLATDADNCGGCGVACGPGIACVDGACEGITGGASGGQAVVIAANYGDVALGDPEAVLLGNALFLHPSEPLRVLDYAEHVQIGSPALEIVTDLMGDEAIIRDRTVQAWTLPSDNQLHAALATDAFDVLLVRDQDGAPEDRLVQIGASWKQALASFMAKGGVVVVLGSTLGNNEMGAFLEKALGFETAFLHNVSSQSVTNVAPGDPLGWGVLPTFVTGAATAALPQAAGSTAGVTVVVTDATSSPVALRLVP
jgi:hypothetical protein